MTRKNEFACSFCGKHESQVEKLIAGLNVYICNQCIETCNQILTESEEKPVKKEFNLTPKQIHSILSDYVIGQDEAKKILSVAVYNHYKRIREPFINGVELEKSNILLMGPTGVGKTLLVRTLAKILNVPYVLGEATSLTQAGYVGSDVEELLARLIQKANGNIKEAEQGIVYIDEIDKLSRKSDSPSITRDVSGEGVQQSLLKIVEGHTVSVPPDGGRKHPHQKLILIDTTKILFIVGGTFDGLEEIVKKRLGQLQIGFGGRFSIKKKIDEKEKMMKNAVPRDLIHYGIIPELVGRLPVMAVCHDLNEEHLFKILTKPKNALVKQYQELFKMDGYELDFKHSALKQIVKETLKRGTGARGLRSISEKVLLSKMFELPSIDKEKQAKKIAIDKKTVEKELGDLKTQSQEDSKKDLQKIA